MKKARSSEGEQRARVWSGAEINQHRSTSGGRVRCDQFGRLVVGSSPRRRTSRNRRRPAEHPLHRVPILAIIDSVEFVGRDALDRADGKALALAIAKCGRAAQTRIRNQSERVATPDYVICLEDSKKFKSLNVISRRTVGSTQSEYREKWGLEPDYLMVAPNYAAQRSTIAKAAGSDANRSLPRPEKVSAKRKPRLSEGSLSARQPQARCQRQLAIRTVGQAILIPSDLRLRLRAMLSIADSRRVLLR